METIAPLISPMFFGGWAYAILCLQVVSGFPPLYVHLKSKHQAPGYAERHLKFAVFNSWLLFLSAVFIFVPSMFENQLVRLSSMVAAFFCATLFGFRQRRLLKEEPHKPLPLIDYLRFRLPVIGEITNRYPMLPFDIWTIGFAFMMYLIVFFSIAN